VSKDTIIKLIQPGNVEDQLTEIFAQTGRVPARPGGRGRGRRLSPQAYRLRRPRTATSGSCATVTCRSAR